MVIIKRPASSASWWGAVRSSVQWRPLLGHERWSSVEWRAVLGQEDERHQSHGRTLGEGAQRIVGVERIRRGESHAKVRDAMALSSWFDWRWGWQNREATVFPRMICTFPENGL